MRGPGKWMRGRTLAPARSPWSGCEDPGRRRWRQGIGRLPGTWRCPCGWWGCTPWGGTMFCHRCWAEHEWSELGRRVEGSTWTFRPGTSCCCPPACWGCRWLPRLSTSDPLSKRSMSAFRRVRQSSGWRWSSARERGARWATFFRDSSPGRRARASGGRGPVTAEKISWLLVVEVAAIFLILERASAALESAGSAGCPWSFTMQ